MATYWEQDRMSGFTRIYRLHEEGEVLGPSTPQQDGYPVLWFDGQWKWARYNIGVSQAIPDTVTTQREREAWVLAQWRMI